MECEAQSMKIATNIEKAFKNRKIKVYMDEDGKIVYEMKVVIKNSDFYDIADE